MPLPNLSAHLHVDVGNLVRWLRSWTHTCRTQTPLARAPLTPAQGPEPPQPGCGFAQEPCMEPG